ncbi:MAG: hypothetical protein CO118_04765 [Flavobacteriales bacterium CG_4_9_14_3_um_filter_32_8]|nr:MAG: hypothetical protein CO118_04765 [Flavobacteriales bacterium CG_4_9_14_3_um_filter_32_8]
MKKFNLLFITVLILLSSCASNKKILTAKPMSINNSGATSCELIEKGFTNKAGKIEARKELYLRCSIQDYFIKICEGNVTYEELKPYLNSGITVKMEIREGMWDHCEENSAYTQSRTGTYVIIKSIEK